MSDILEQFLEIQKFSKYFQKLTLGNDQHFFEIFSETTPSKSMETTISNSNNLAITAKCNLTTTDSSDYCNASVSDRQQWQWQ